MLFRGNCHDNKLSYLILVFAMRSFILNALLKLCHCIKSAYIPCHPMLCSYGYNWIPFEMYSSGVLRTVGCVLTTNTFVKCDILNSISPLSDAKLRGVHWAKTHPPPPPRVHLTVIIFHPITQFSTAACTQQLTRSNSYTNVSHFSAYCVDIINCTPEGCCCRNDGTRAGIDKAMLWTKPPPHHHHPQPPCFPPRGDQTFSLVHWMPHCAMKW